MAEKIPQFDSPLTEKDLERISSAMLADTLAAFDRDGYRIKKYVDANNVDHYTVSDKKGKVIADYTDDRPKEPLGTPLSEDERRSAN